MDRAQLEEYIQCNYGAQPEYLWAKYPDFAVFRHAGSQKWFALLLAVPKNRLGLPQPGTLPVVNVKCDPLMLGSLLQEPGFFPAYHMNKNSWITAALDGSVEDEKLKLLVELSYDAAAPKLRRRKTETDKNTKEEPNHVQTHAKKGK